MLLVEKGHRVAVLAVDPSSARSGGSVLADKTRMERLSQRARGLHPPLPFRRHPRRGRAQDPRDHAGLRGGRVRRRHRRDRRGRAVGDHGRLDGGFLPGAAAGRAPATSCRGSRRGSWSWPTRSPSTRPTGTTCERAERAPRSTNSRCTCCSRTPPTGPRRCLTCSALEMTGIEAIWDTVLRHRDVFGPSGELEERRRQQAVAWMWSLVEEGLKDRFARQPEVRRQLPRILHEVERGSLAPTAAAERLLFLLTATRNTGDIPTFADDAAAASVRPAAAVAARHGTPVTAIGGRTPRRSDARPDGMCTYTRKGTVTHGHHR